MWSRIDFFIISEHNEVQNINIIINSILCNKGVHNLFTHERRARRSPECVKKLLEVARVAYVILWNSVCKVRHNECTHGNEKPPPPIRDGRLYRGKERVYGGKKRVQRQSPRRGGGGRGPLYWLNKTFSLLGFVHFSAIQTRNSSKILEKK